MEQVLVVERSSFFGGQWPEGFTPIPDPRPLLTRFEAVGFFVPRPEAEDNPAWKQPIPYCLVTQGEQLFTVRRTRGQSERRLHGLRGKDVEDLHRPIAAFRSPPASREAGNVTRGA